MVSEFLDSAIILKVGRFRDADVWTRLYLSGRGALTAFAFGGARSRKRFGGCLDGLNHVRVKVKADRLNRYLNLEEATLVHGFPTLRTRSDRLGRAVNCVKFFEAAFLATQTPESAAAALRARAPDSREAFDLLLGVLQFLDQAADDRDVELAPSYFRYRTACAQGHEPALSACGLCGADMSGTGHIAFDIAEGRALCARCERLSSGREREILCRESVSALEAVSAAAPGAAGSWPVRLSTGAKARTCRFVDGFTRRHMGVEWANGTYRRD